MEDNLHQYRQSAKSKGEQTGATNNKLNQKETKKQNAIKTEEQTKVENPPEVQIPKNNNTDALNQDAIPQVNKQPQGGSTRNQQTNLNIFQTNKKQVPTKQKQ